MRKHRSKIGPEVSSGTVPATWAADAPPAQNQTPSAKCAQLAYLYWEARGRTDGSAEEDWVRAEQEVKARRL
jgi:hypothetical protein